MQAVILAGGAGTRMREETEFKPKPMVEIGGRPVLWHLMNSLSRQGIVDFVILAGYKVEIIKEYFLHLDAYTNDFKISMGDSGAIEILGKSQKNWAVTIVDTGLRSETGRRLAMAEKIIGSQKFFCTYGDGLASVSLEELLRSHTSGGLLGTMTVTQPTNRFGVVSLNSASKVEAFHEKPIMAELINIGYFVFEPDVFGLLGPDEALETGLIRKLVDLGQLKAYKHNGFWEPMDTYREYVHLNSLWDAGQSPWLIT